MNTLHLILKAQWYNMIESGEKKSEYREISPYWVKRLINSTEPKGYVECLYRNRPQYLATLVARAIASGYLYPYDAVTFHYGYTNRTMTFKIEDIHICCGIAAWGAEEGKQYFVIKLGERIMEWKSDSAWVTMEKFDTKAARDRRMQQLLQDPHIVTL